METFSLPTLTVSLVAWFTGIALSLRQRDQSRSRTVAAGSALLAAISSLATAVQIHSAGAARLSDPWLGFLAADLKISIVLTLLSFITSGLVILAPRRDSSGGSLAGLLLIGASAEIAYCAVNLPLSAVGWGLSVLPLCLGVFGGNSNLRPVSRFLWLSTALAVAAMLRIQADSSGLLFALLLVAIALRKGLVPMHPWLMSAFERGPLLATGLVFNTHFGASLLTRPEVLPLFTRYPIALDVVSYTALLTALITSLRCFIEKSPRRLVALICISQASFILAGLVTSNDAGITGAWVHWLVVVTASSGLVAILRILEVRVMDVASPEGELGLAVRAPRLATSFLICSLALIGLPGTLGYCAEDLLFHGALSIHPFLGVVLPLATAFNAINLFRLYSLLFLGVLPKRVIDVPDALRRERWPLTACILILVVLGIAPRGIIANMSSPSIGSTPPHSVHAAHDQPGH
ncbi:MAG: proton-conducting transporter membrane subunit [Verrucomicrobia bacterium]|nr:proton-conducting transporter membrane subunit [Verrucomicrobiota bacterium]